jgi:hypothetical protein
MRTKVVKILGLTKFGDYKTLLYLCSMEETEEINQEQQGQPAEVAQPMEIYQFMFMKQPIRIPADKIDITDIIILNLIEEHGWGFYERLKMNYNYQLPNGAALEHIINLECMRDEIGG